MTKPGKKKSVPMIQLQKMLAIIWGATFVIGIIIMLLFTARLGDAMAEGWGWFSQTFVPTMAVIGAGMIKNQGQRETRMVDLFFYKYTSVALVFYGLVALATPLITPTDTVLMTWLGKSATWLSILQGGIVGFVTFAFGKEEPPEADRITPVGDE